MNTRYLAAGFVLAVLLLSSSAAYRVGEAEQVIITQFGNPVGDPITDPGLHFKVPFIQDANYFDKRFLEWDGNPNQVPTKDKRFIWVDTYARWRIVDPLLFFQRLRDERGAQSRLDDILDGEMRNAVARYDLIELVRNTNRNPDDVPIEAEEEQVILNVIQKGRDQVSREILEVAARRTADLGIELLDLRIKRINYVEEVQRDVFARMIAERQRIAELYRSEGQGEAARIQGERERELQRITSEAFKTAEQLRGKADAEATEIYASAHNRDADFYAFTRSLEAYEKVMDPGTMAILGTDSEFLEVPSASALRWAAGARHSEECRAPPTSRAIIANSRTITGMPCPHCGNEVPAASNRCPICAGSCTRRRRRIDPAARNCGPPFVEPPGRRSHHRTAGRRRADTPAFLPFRL